MKDDQPRSRRLTDLALSTIITFAVVFGLNAITQRLTLPHGRITLGRALSPHGGSVATVDIANFRERPLSGVRLSIPASVADSAITSSQPVRVHLTRQDGVRGQRAALVVDEVPGHRLTRLQISVEGDPPPGTIEVLNAGVMRVDVESDDVQGFRVWDVLGGPVVGACFAVLIYVIAFLLYHRYVDRLLARLDDARAEGAKAQEDLKRFDEEGKTERAAIRKELNEVEGRVARQRVLLLARIGDYAKELAFWRDTVRALLYAEGKQSIDADRVFEEVTRALETYGTQDRAATDIHALEALAALSAGHTRDR